MSDKPVVLRDYSIQIGGDTQYQPKFCQMLVNHRCTGKSFASFGLVAGVGIKTLKKWAEENLEFQEAIELAEVASLSYWEDKMGDQATGEIKGSSTTLLAIMKNNFGDFYRDKTEVEHKGGVVFRIATGIPFPEDTKIVEDIECEVIEQDDDLL